jgi:hypothetical protein
MLPEFVFRKHNGWSFEYKNIFYCLDVNIFDNKSYKITQ